MKFQHKLIISAVLILIGVTIRLMPHIWNVAPIAAIALVSAVYLGRSYAFIVPALAMFIGDLFVGFYDIGVMVSVYASFVLIGFIGLYIKNKKNTSTIVLASIAASVLFFLVSNWAVWQFTPWYDKSIAGLLQTYTMAIPFFRNTIVGDLIYTGSFFAVFEFATIYMTAKKPQKQINSLIS